jgi:hypothetical protein
MCFHPRWMYIAKTIAHQQIHSALVNCTCMQHHQCFSQLAKPITIIQRDNIFPCQLVVLGVIYVFIDLLIMLSLNTCNNSPMNFTDRCKIEQSNCAKVFCTFISSSMTASLIWWVLWMTLATCRPNLTLLFLGWKLPCVGCFSDANCLRIVVKTLAP